MRVWLGALATGAALVAAGCAARVPILALDETPADQRVAAAQLRIFPLGASYPANAKVLTPVEAYSCKHLVTDPPASRGNAIQQLQIKALQAGGNAIVNVTFETRGTDTFGTNCWETVSASGFAARID